MLKWINGLVDRIFAVAGALTLSQAPLFMQQYSQTLSGHVAELNIQIAVIRNAAAQSGKTLEQYIQKFTSSPDSDFSKQGQILQGMLERFTSLSDAYSALSNTTVFTKPFIFVRYLNFDMIQSTLKHFQPGIAFTVEGLVYAMIGLGIGYMAYWCLSTLIVAFYQTIVGVGVRKEIKP